MDFDSWYLIDNDVIQKKTSFCVKLGNFTFLHFICLGNFQFKMYLLIRK